MLIDFSYGREFDEVFNRLRQSKFYKEFATLDGIGEQTDMVKFSKRFFGKTTATADVSVDSNANVEDSSVIAYEAEVPKPLFRMNAYYLLYKYGKKLFGPAIAEGLVEMQFYKYLYINDFHKFAVCPYCFNFSCLDVVFNGLPFVKKIKSEPPKHFSSYVNQMIQFVTYTSNSVAGAVGLADFLICCSWYVDKERPSIKEVEQELQSFIYSVNQPFRGGHQSAFTNVSLFDHDFLSKLCKEYSFPDGTKPNEDVVLGLQVVYMKVMNDTLSKTPCTFPVTTACFSVDKDRNIKDQNFLRQVCLFNQDYGWINFYAGNTSTLSSCCRLRSDNSHHYFNSFGSGGTKIGSLSVTTLNLPRLAYEANTVCHTKEDAVGHFMETLGMEVQDAGYINHIKRYIVGLRIKNGNLPLYSLGFMDLKKQYSTCGLNGINEAVEILGYDILTKEGQEIVRRMLEIVNKTNEKLEERFGYPHNCEQTPSENSAIKLATADRLLGYNDNYDLYSNQFIPLTTKADMLDRVMLQGKFDSYMTGGAILHINIGEKIENVDDMMDLIKNSVKQGVIYQAVNYVMNVCEDGHITVGMGDKCSICGKKITDKLTRVVGFLTNTKNWHKVRREKDFPNRKFYEV
jgi:anaerobic ribonucleoside-triphosphate reductase